MNKKTFTLILNGIALAMGVASIVLGILNTASTQTILMLLAIGLSALALNALDIRGEKQDQ
ncbi:MAG: hypothetical protein HZB51_32715 [Chloroflexi bacterium]|nr:hypothetical protein [Chloroflexota bacterium]